MARISPSIIHLIGFFVSTFVSVIIFAKIAIIGSSGGLSELITLFTFRHTADLSCEVSKHNPQTSRAQYSCDKISCIITIFDPQSHQSIKSFSPVDNSGTRIININNFFADDGRKVISYTTSAPDLSARIVMNFEGELIQSIDETPGENRVLTYLGYQPETGMLVYQDEVSNQRYFYSIDSVYFARRKCR